MASRPTCTVAVPTRARAGYLDAALRSAAPQARATGAELLVIDDGGGDPATRAVAERHGARCVAHDHPRGLNAARNTAAEQASGELLCFLDDDVEADPGWLDALLDAAAEQPDHDVLGGPIRPRLERARPLRACGREGPPITFLDLGAEDRDAERVWGANLAVRRAALERVGPFDETLDLYGDEEDWQARLRAVGGHVRYVAAAGVDHRRAGPDATLPALARAAYGRGRHSRRFDARRGTAPPLAAELRVLAGCAWHTARRACAQGVLMGAHSAGRVREALAPAPSATAPDFLADASGEVAGRRGALLAAADRALDLEARLSGRQARLVRAARDAPPRRRVLVAGVDRPERHGLMGAARAELARSRHDVTLALGPGEPGRGKFENLDALLASSPPVGHDWLLVVDDDVVLPRGFLDGFLFLAERFDLRLAQPAHRLHSHAAWPVTRRRPRSAVRETWFVEIGPVTAFHSDTFADLLPFPPLRMGWGLDVHWAARARERGWRMGVVDALPVLHAVAPAAATYPREAAIAEARAFLEGRPYVPRAQAARTLAVHRAW